MKARQVFIYKATINAVQHLLYAEHCKDTFQAGLAIMKSTKLEGTTSNTQY